MQNEIGQKAFGMGFVGSMRDRFHALRADQPALEALWTKGMVLPLWRGQPLFGPEGLAFLPSDHTLLRLAGVGFSGATFLGMTSVEGQERGLFTLDVSAWQPDEGIPQDPSLGQGHPALGADFAFRELRQTMAQLTVEHGDIAATARAMCEWHRSNGFCAKCGAPSQSGGGGWHRSCAKCKAQHFPRTDPCVIMLVVKDDKLLLGRSGGWAQGMYSLLAGFIEPGETMEAAVCREVMEETGISCGQVRYLASQPWPFPASLMLGCIATAYDETITIDPIELEDALWIDRASLGDVIAGRHGQISPPRMGSIARKLIEGWLEGSLNVS